jgi:DNA-binding LytR/AlgR family response regulator
MVMRRISCLVVDDEELARTLLINYIGRVSFLELAGECRDALEAARALRAMPVDLVFLDIQMPEITGVEWLRTMARRPLVIFTTAYSDYALEGYQLDVADYLLKPFSFERFLQAVNKAAERLRLEAAAARASPEPLRDHLLVKSEHKIHRLKYEDIRYIQSMREHVAFHTPRGRILSLNSLKNLEGELPSDRFLRIHKSYIVAIERVDSVEGNMVVLGGEKLPIGASYREGVLERLLG